MLAEFIGRHTEDEPLPNAVAMGQALVEMALPLDAAFAAKLARLATAPNPNDPQYRPSAGRRIARGVLGALAGLGEGGIKGALVGGIMPQVTTGTGYSAPAGQFSARARANAQRVSNLDQQIATAEKEAQLGNPAVKDATQIAGGYGDVANEAGRLTTADARNQTILQNAAKNGQIPVYDENGVLTGFKDDPNSQAYKDRVAMNEYRSEMAKVAQIQAEIKAQGITPGTPAWNQKQQEINAITQRAESYMGNYLMRAKGGRAECQGLSAPGQPAHLEPPGRSECGRFPLFGILDIVYRPAPK